MAGHGDVYEMHPDNERDVEANRAAIKRLREEYRTLAKEFIMANRGLVESIAQDLVKTNYLGCDDIAARVKSVVKPAEYKTVSWPASVVLFSEGVA